LVELRIKAAAKVILLWPTFDVSQQKYVDLYLSVFAKKKVLSKDLPAHTPLVEKNELHLNLKIYELICDSLFCKPFK